MESHNQGANASVEIWCCEQTWQDVNLLEFLIASGEDPMTGLQIKLERQNYDLSIEPSSICNNLESQTIYSFDKQ